MSFRRSAPVVSIATVVVVLIAMAWANNRLFAGMTDQVEADRFALMRAVATTSLSDAQDQALARAELVAKLASVRHDLGTGDRPALLNELKPAFDLQKERFGVRLATFTTPPATMFVRLHDPEKGIGEDGSAFRPLIVDVNTKHEPLRGVVMSRSGVAITGVAPVEDDLGQHAGAVEFGLDFAPLLDRLKSTYNLDAAVYFDEAQLKEVATHLPPETFADANRVGAYIRFYSTDTERMRVLVTDRDLDRVEEHHYLREAFGVPYGVVVVPVLDYKGQPFGMMTVTGDFSSSRASAGRTMAWQGLMVLLGSVFCAGTLIVVIRGMILRPLGVIEGRLAALAGGDASQKLDPEAEGFCDEMASFARTYEALRAKGES